MWLQEFVLPWQCLLSSFFSLCLPTQTSSLLPVLPGKSRNPSGCSLTNSLLSSFRKKKSYIKQKSIHRLYSSLHDASSRTGAVWEVANSRKPLRLVCYPVWPNQTHSSSYPCSSRGTALLSSLNPVEVYSHCFQPPLCQGTYLCFTCALSLHSLKIPNVFPVYYSKTSVPALLICPKMWLIRRGFFFWNLFL